MPQFFVSPRIATFTASIAVEYEPEKGETPESALESWMESNDPIPLFEKTDDQVKDW